MVEQFKSGNARSIQPLEGRVNFRSLIFASASRLTDSLSSQESLEDYEGTYS
jgi:hypothetical protein